MKVTIFRKSSFANEITAPPSKAHTHRALFAGLLSEGVTTIENPLACTDTEATTNAITSLGASVERATKVWTVRGQGQPIATASEIDCGESGVTLRFTIPIASLTGERTLLAGDESLMRRPIEPLTKAMNQLGVRVAADKRGVCVEGGRPKGGEVTIRGDVSSQFISGLLFAAPEMTEGLELQLTSPLQSRNYVLLTIETMRRQGVKVTTNTEFSRFKIPPGQRYEPVAHLIPGDYSSGAFPMAAAAITESELLVRGLTKETIAPDSEIVEFLSQMGAKTNFRTDGVLIKGDRLNGVNVDIHDCPDLGPVMAVLACFAEGETRITGASRLRYKESDRLEAIALELRSIGANIEETADGLVIHGPCSLKCGTVHSHGDHRIAMALGVAAVGTEGPFVIEGAECVAKSYPNFFDDMRSLGVEIIDG